MPNVSISNLTATWSNGGTTYAAIKMDVTDTASAATSALFDLQVGSSSKFKVDKFGNVTANTITANPIFDYAQITLKPSANLYASLAGTVPSNTLKINARNYVNTQLLSYTNSSGRETLVQPHLGYKYFLKVQPGVGAGTVIQPGVGQTTIVTNTNNLFYETIGSGISLLVNNGGSYSVANPTYNAINPLLNRTRRFKMNTATPSMPLYMIEHGNYLTLIGGFFFTTKFCIESLTGTTFLMFVGLDDGAPTPPNAGTDYMSTSMTKGRIGVAANTTTGNLSMVASRSTPNNMNPSAIIDLGSNFPITNGNFYELTLSSAPASNVIAYSITNLVSGVSANGEYTSADIPTNSNALAIAPTLFACNDNASGAVTFSSTGYYVEYN